MLLSSCHFIEQDGPKPYYMICPDDYWAIISEQKRESDLYYDALEKGQTEANRAQVAYWSQIMVQLRRDYRSFFVVHTEPSKVDWQEQLQHIDEIMTPEKCIEYFEQPAQGNRFDFFEWAFEEKQGWFTTEAAMTPDASAGSEAAMDTS
jgi:chromo domain-containing protein 1